MSKKESLQKLAQRLGRQRLSRKAEVPLIPGAQPRPRFNPPAPCADSSLPRQLDQNNSDSATDSAPRVIQFGNPIVFGFMLTVGVGLALLGYFLLMNVGALTGWITGALFIALGLDPAVRKLESFGLPRPASIFAVVLVIAAALTGIFIYLIPKLASQTVAFISSFPDRFDDFLNSDLMVDIDAAFGIRHWAETEVTDLFGKLTQDSNMVSAFLNSLVDAGSTITSIVTGTLVVLFLSLYFLISMPLLKAWFVRLTPASKREKVAYLTEEITASVGHYVMGQGIVALLNGAVAFILMMLTGVPYAQLLTLFVILLAFIPLVGGVSAGILVSLIALTDSLHTCLWYALGYFIYLQIEAYFVSPRIMSKAVAVPGGIAIIAVAAGGALWGVLGAIIAIPVAASLLILVREVLVPRQDSH